MIARLAGAALALFAFSVSVLAGLYVGNPVTLVLSRGILALVLFFLIGLALGAAAQLVVREYSEARLRDLESSLAPTATPPPGTADADSTAGKT